MRSRWSRTCAFAVFGFAVLEASAAPPAHPPRIHRASPVTPPGSAPARPGVEATPEPREEAPAEAASAARGTWHLGLEGYGFSEKAAIGPRIRYESEWLGAGLSVAPMYLMRGDDSGLLTHRWLGAVWATHMGVNLRPHRFLTVSPGLGVDVYDLWHNLGYEFGVDGFVEVRAHPLEFLSLFVQGRYYLYTTRGLGVNSTRTGEHGLPWVFTTGAEVAL